MEQPAPEKPNLTLYRHPGLYLQQVRDKGRGVFCLQDLKQDDVLEIAPLLIFPASDTPHIFNTLLANYVFSAKAFPKEFLKTAGIDNVDKSIYLPMGIASICNHMVDPNTVYEFAADGTAAFLALCASRDVPKGEELVISYGETWITKRKLAFGTIKGLRK